MDDSKPISPLEIPELLEKVLLHLTQGEILQLQRVNHFWADIISESPPLQQKLFFQPLPPSKAAGRPADFNPLVEALFPFLFEPHPYPGGWFAKCEADKTIQHWAGDPNKRQAVLRPEASWRRMLPVQPAAPLDALVKTEWILPGGYDFFKRIAVVEWCEVDSSKHVSTSTATSNLGGNATMGLLYDIILPILSLSLDSAICVQWNMVKWTYEQCKNSPQRVGGYVFALRKANYKSFDYDKLDVRNAITIHANVGHRRGDSSMYWSRMKNPTPFHKMYSGLKEKLWGPEPVYPTDLGIILDLPVGVVRDGNKANRYRIKGSRMGYWGDDSDYSLYGKRVRLETDLEVELRESAKLRESEKLHESANNAREDALLALHWETY